MCLTVYKFIDKKGCFWCSVFRQFLDINLSFVKGGCKEAPLSPGVIHKTNCIVRRIEQIEIRINVEMEVI